MPKAKERRAHPRSPCQVPVTIVSDEFAWRGTVLDYSEGGAFITATLQPGVGTTLLFRFQRPDDAALVEVQGVVRRISSVKGGSPDQLGFGIQFNEPLSGVEPVG